MLALAACGPSDDEPPLVVEPTPERGAATGPSHGSDLFTVDHLDYRGAGGDYYFTSPTGTWRCGIVTSYDGDHSAGCHGPFPDTVEVTQDGSPHRGGRPNAVWLIPGRPADFIVAGNPMFQPRGGTTPPVLPYDHALIADGITCSVDEARGVTCTDGAGHGFTVSGTAGEVY